MNSILIDRPKDRRCGEDAGETHGGDGTEEREPSPLRTKRPSEVVRTSDSKKPARASIAA